MEPGASQAATIAARRWTRGLTADQRTLIERFAIVQARDVAARLDRLQTHFGPADASLDLTWQALCWDRDDVEERQGNLKALCELDPDALPLSMKPRSPFQLAVRCRRARRAPAAHLRSAIRARGGEPRRQVWL
jgi:hypothetical protein